MIEAAKNLARLAGPVILSRAGIMVMSAADSIMVGRFSAQELAYLSIGNAPFVTLMVTSFGLMTGGLVMTAFEFGAGNPKRCGIVWRRSLAFGVALGLAGLALAPLGDPFLVLAGQTADLSRGGGRVLAIMNAGLLPMLVYIAGSHFLEGIRRPVPPMLMMAAANLINIGLNWMFIGGRVGLPAMGAEGAAWASTASRGFLAVCILVFLWKMRDRDRFAIRGGGLGVWREWVRQRRIGYGAGASMAIESAAFTILSLFAGLLGTLPLGAYSIAFNLMSLVFMIALGLSYATTILVGISHGRRDARAIRLAGWTGLAVNTLVMGVIALFFALLAEPLARAYTTDAHLLALTPPLIAFAALVLFSDGGQMIMTQALRGRGETWVPAVMHLVAFFGVMVPLGWLFAHTLDHGPRGLLEAVLCGTGVALIGVAWRFHRLAARDPVSLSPNC